MEEHNQGFVVLRHFAHQIQDMGTDYNRFNQVYKRTQGSTRRPAS